MKIAKNGLREF